jgi:flagellar export protein FliJ
MKRFAFKLQAVLTLRQRAEQVALEKYARAIEHRQLCAATLADAEMELSEARRQWLNALADGVPAVRAAQMLGFCHLLEERKRQCEQTLELADIELNRSSQAMLQARQQREAVETLMARQRERYDHRMIEEERKMIDDLINRRPPGQPSGQSSFRSNPAMEDGPASDNVWN